VTDGGDPPLTSTPDTVVITVVPDGDNEPPTVDAGKDQIIYLPKKKATLYGTVTDDGRPVPPGKVTTTWIQVSGPGMAEFANKNALDTKVTFSTAGEYPLAGTYPLRLEANDGGLELRSDVVVITLCKKDWKTISEMCPDLRVEWGFTR
jgi:hypothetical protein